MHENEGTTHNSQLTTHNRKILASFLTSFLCCAACLLGMASCNGNGGTSDSGGQVYAGGSTSTESSGGGSPSADSGSGEGAASGNDDRTFTAADLLELSNSGTVSRIVDLLTDRDEASSETTTLDLTAASLSLPAGCTIVITLTIDGKAQSYTAREENGSFHFEFPFVASDTEVQAVMDVYDATGMLILTGTAEKTVSGTLDTLEVSLVPPAESSSDGPFTVTFDTAGGSAVAAQLVAEGASAAEPAAPTRAGYDFGGWYADPAGTAAYDFSLPVTEDITLSARWTAIEYTVTYHLPSGLTGVTVNSSGTVPDTDSYTVEAGLPSLATVTCTSVSFGGWFPSDSYTDGSEVSSIPSGPSGIPSGSGTNTDLYGKFSATISFDTGTGGSAVADLDVVYGEEAELPSPGPTRAGYFFAGWYTAASGGTEYDFSSPVTADITLYARWRTAAQFLDSLTESDVQAMNPTGTGTIAPDYTALKDTPVYFKLADGSYGALVFTDVDSDYSISFCWRKIPGTATVKSGFQIRWGFDLNGNYTNDDTKDFGLDSNGGSYSFTAYNGATFCVGNAP